MKNLPALEEHYSPALEEHYSPALEIHYSLFNK